MNQGGRRRSGRNGLSEEVEINREMGEEEMGEERGERKREGGEIE